MRIYDASKPLISIHLPKAGGTSLLSVLEDWFPNGSLRLHYRQADGKLPLRQVFSGPICIHGHFNTAAGFGISDYYPQAEQFIIFFREPFERFVSVWFFLNRLKKEKIPVAAPDTGRDFETFIRIQAEHHSENANHFSFVHHFPPEATVGKISTALATSFVFVGIIERYQESLSALAHLIGRPPRNIPHLNDTPRSGTEYQEFRPFYEKNFADEMELYEAALKANSYFIREAL